MFWKIKKMLVSSTNIKKYRAVGAITQRKTLIFMVLKFILSSLKQAFQLLIQSRILVFMM
ncbi:hypothetical protein HMPREF2593_09640 [Enterococcus sp. HMSC035C10]|nr:hypothetical protein HMPREF1381_02813 [Enterococcus faecium R501]EJY45800.1 hypothetical protein HMPREF1349_01623 [Enterococcus faecium 506]EPI24692.1 hypothetical protein D353_00060 [Enterococcus faecium OC2A-1]OHO46674.1 hypothetical protein HMPREF2593_09640 [Enterococcus sp. HMSC035C10]